jgi:hypothetical protein
MTDSWNDMRRAKEEEFFDRQNREALERLKARKDEKTRLSPITGEPLEAVTVMGVAVDRCPKTGGIWLDAGELELIIKAATEAKDKGWAESFLGKLMGK